MFGRFPARSIPRAAGTLFGFEAGA